MVHPADFVDAHLRHWKDAELLFKYDRWANADQLYGLCAECGLKAVMRRSGMQVETLGVPTRPEHRVHVNKLWPEFPAFVSGRIGGRYVNLLPASNPFTNWSIGNRYAHNRHFHRARVEPHRKAARNVCRMVQRGKQDGLL